MAIELTLVLVGCNPGYVYLNGISALQEIGTRLGMGNIRYVENRKRGEEGKEVRYTHVKDSRQEVYAEYFPNGTSRIRCLIDGDDRVNLSAINNLLEERLGGRLSYQRKLI